MTVVQNDRLGIRFANMEPCYGRDCIKSRNRAAKPEDAKMRAVLINLEWRFLTLMTLGYICFVQQ